MQSVAGELSEDVSVLQRAAQDCVDNTDGDPAAASSSQKVQACAQQIQAAIEQVQAVISAMQQELDDIQAAVVFTECNENQKRLITEYVSALKAFSGSVLWDYYQKLSPMFFEWVQQQS